MDNNLIILISLVNFALNASIFYTLKQFSKRRKLLKGEKVNINKASVDDLTLIPEVGPSLAKKIVNGRPYNTISELTKVDGIGVKNFSEIEPWVTV